MRERADHRIVLDRHALPEHHERLDHDVAAELGVGREEDGFRRDQGDARFHRRLAQPLLQRGFGLGELRPGVDAAHVVLLGLDHDRLQPHRPGDRDRVGEIVFALAIVIADPCRGSASAVGPANAIRPPLHRSIARSAGAGVELLADGDELAVLQHQPPIAGRVGRAEAEHRDRRACGQCRAHSRQRLRPDQRRVAENDENIVGAARDRALGGQHRMRGAAPLAPARRSPRPARPAALRPRPHRAPGPITTAVMVPPASRTASSTCASSDRPAIACSTFGRAERMRVPSPAASTIARQVRSGVNS